MVLTNLISFRWGEKRNCENSCPTKQMPQTFLFVALFRKKNSRRILRRCCSSCRIRLDSALSPRTFTSGKLGCFESYTFLLSYIWAQVNTVGIWIRPIGIPNFMKFGIKMACYSNGWSICFGLCTRPVFLNLGYLSTMSYKESNW